MKKILLMSDTHSFMDENILAYAKNVDEIWHAGDIGDASVSDALAKVKPLRAVYGNIDNNEIRKTYPRDQIFEIDGVKIWITHIGGYPKRYEKRVLQQLSKIKPQIFISGHSHILKVQYDKQHQLLHLNPGAVGKYGFHQVRTMLRFCIENGKAKDLEVIELESRR